MKGKINAPYLSVHIGNGGQVKVSANPTKFWGVQGVMIPGYRSLIQTLNLSLTLGR